MMPNAALKACAYPGCIQLVQHGHCDVHRSTEHDYHNPEHQRLYNSRRWKARRARQLAREPWCAECLRVNIYVPATDVDHIIPHRGDVHIFFSGSLQSLCRACHSRKTAGEVLNKGSRI